MSHRRKHTTDPYQLSAGAKRAIEKAATEFNADPNELLDALAHYVTSIWRRPGSWEANTRFDWRNYQEPGEDAEGLRGMADRWFDDEKDYWQ